MHYHNCAKECKRMQKVDFCSSQVSWPKWRASMVDDQEALVSDAACDFYHLDADHDGLLAAQLERIYTFTLNLQRAKIP